MCVSGSRLTSGNINQIVDAKMDGMKDPTSPNPLPHTLSIPSELSSSVIHYLLILCLYSPTQQNSSPVKTERTHPLLLKSQRPISTQQQAVLHMLSSTALAVIHHKRSHSTSDTSDMHQWYIDEQYAPSAVQLGHLRLQWVPDVNPNQASCTPSSLSKSTGSFEGFEGPPRPGLFFSRILINSS